MSAKHVDDCSPIKHDDWYDRSGGSSVQERGLPSSRPDQTVLFAVCPLVITRVDTTCIYAERTDRHS